MTDTALNEAIEHVAQLLKQAHYAVAFTGAGMSTESGIPDFRSPGSGLWEHVDPMEVASIYGFRQNPKAFYDWVRPLAKTTLNTQPNAGHYTLAELEARGILQAIITQNIDMLHSRAGSKTVFEIHGNMREATCIHCFTVYPAAPILAQLMEDGKVPHCPKCNSVLKPNVVLFGEQLPVREFQAAKEAARKADLMIVVGSSLEVAPASEIPVLAYRTGAKLIIVNLEATSADQMAEVVIRGKAAGILPLILEHLERQS